MNVKPSVYNLSWNNKAQVGDQVCPANGATKVGVILEIKKSNYDWEGKTYKVLWATGKQKGKISEHIGRNLANLNNYKKAINDIAAEVNALSAEAKAFGM